MPKNKNIDTEILRAFQKFILDNVSDWLLDNTYDHNNELYSEVKFAPTYSDKSNMIESFNEYLSKLCNESGFYKDGNDVIIEGKTYNLILRHNNDAPCVKCSFFNKNKLKCDFPDGYERECEFVSETQNGKYTIEYKLKKSK